MLTNCINSTGCQPNKLYYRKPLFSGKNKYGFSRCIHSFLRSYSSFSQQSSELEGSKTHKAGRGIKDYLAQPLHFTDEERDAWTGEVADI